MTDIDWDELRQVATEAMARAYAPYSRYKVGAAALVSDGRIVSGCNVENASYGVGLCAECALVGDLHMSGGGELVAFVCVNGEGETIINRWFDRAGGARAWRWQRLPGEFHGSGCTLASAIAARLALGQALPEALDLGQSYCHAALAGAYAIAPGQLMPQRFIQ